MKTFKIDYMITPSNSPERCDLEDYVKEETPEEAFKTALNYLEDAINDFSYNNECYGKINDEESEVYAQNRETDEIKETYYNFRAVDVETEEEYWLGSDGKVYNHRVF